MKKRRVVEGEEEVVIPQLRGLILAGCHLVTDVGLRLVHMCAHMYVCVCVCALCVFLHECNAQCTCMYNMCAVHVCVLA